MKYELSLHSLRQLSRHTRVHLHRRTVLRLFQYPHSQVTGTRTDFEHLVSRAQIGLRMDGFRVRNPRCTQSPHLIDDAAHKLSCD